MLSDDQVEALPYRPCVGLVVINSEGLIWAGLRVDATKNGYPDAWQMPQGGIDPGESVMQAAMRELGEETSIAPSDVEVLGETADWYPYELPRDLIGKLWKGKYRGQTQKWVALRFTGTDDQINIITDEPEFERWMWIGADELMDKIVPFKRDTYEAVLAEFAPHLAG